MPTIPQAGDQHAHAEPDRVALARCRLGCLLVTAIQFLQAVLPVLRWGAHQLLHLLSIEPQSIFGMMRIWGIMVDTFGKECPHATSPLCTQSDA